MLTGQFYFNSSIAGILANFQKVTLGKRGGDAIRAYVLLVVAGICGYYDLKEHRIPNGWILAGMAAYIILDAVKASGLSDMIPVLLQTANFFLHMFAGASALFILYLFRMIGPGDIKLTALIYGYLGFWDGSIALGYGFFLGAVLSLIKMVYYGNLRERLSYLSAYIWQIYHTKTVTAYYVPARDGDKAVIPLGFCLFLGTLIYIIL